MLQRAIALSICLFLFQLLSQAQSSSNLRAVSIASDNNFDGYELLSETDKRLFVLGEHWHNIRKVPQATLKLLKHLHSTANVRILAIEQGTSVAMMINQYLTTGDTMMLKDIVRNTMFWAQEHAEFFRQLRAFNEQLPPAERITVQSIDIEYKMESAVYVINQWLKDKELPDSLAGTLGEFRRIFETTRPHREQFDNLLVMFYYDKHYMKQLVDFTLDDLGRQPKAYDEILQENTAAFQKMILDMYHGLEFDYTNPLTNYKYRDALIQENFEKLGRDYPDKGVLCVIGMRHMERKSSLYKLNLLDDSPWKNQIVRIRVSALYGGSFFSADLRRIHFAYPEMLKDHPATLIRHDASESALRSKKGFDYTLFINEGGNVRPFPKAYREEK